MFLKLITRSIESANRKTTQTQNVLHLHRHLSVYYFSVSSLLLLFLLLCLCSQISCTSTYARSISRKVEGTSIYREYEEKGKHLPVPAFLSTSSSSVSFVSSSPFMRKTLYSVRTKNNINFNMSPLFFPCHASVKRGSGNGEGGKHDDDNTDTGASASTGGGSNSSGNSNSKDGGDIVAKIPDQSDILKFNQDFSQVLLWQGSDVTASAYEGFLRDGRGGVLVNADMKPVIESETFSVEYIPLFQLLDTDYVIEGLNDDNRNNVIEQMKKYDEENEVVILFGSRGLIGCNTIKPNFPPKFIYENNRGKR